MTQHSVMTMVTISPGTFGRAPLTAQRFNWAGALKRQSPEDELGFSGGCREHAEEKSPGLRRAGRRFHNLLFNSETSALIVARWSSGTLTIFSSVPVWPCSR